MHSVQQAFRQLKHVIGRATMQSKETKSTHYMHRISFYFVVLMCWLNKSWQNNHNEVLKNNRFCKHFGVRAIILFYRHTRVRVPLAVKSTESSGFLTVSPWLFPGFCFLTFYIIVGLIVISELPEHH